MNRCRLALLALLLWPTLSLAQCPGMTSQQTPFAKEVLTVGTTVTPFSATVYKPSGVTPSMAMVTVEGGPIRYTMVGTPPTPNAGHPVGGTVAQTLTICGFDSIAAFRAVRITTDAVMTITYYKSKP